MLSSGTGIWAGELDGLVGRDPTLAGVQELLDTGSRTAVVLGIPGSGKTAVLTVAARAAGVAGTRVVFLTCHASERDLPYGLLVDLLTSLGGESILERVVPHATDGLPCDPLRLRLDVLEHLEHLGDEHPLLLVLDDVQWCDDTSLSVLGFVAHRLTGSRVSILAAARGEVPPAVLTSHPQVGLGPLGESEARALLRMAGVELSAMTLPSVLDRAAGNPLALLELGRAAVDHSLHGVVPSSVEGAFGEQIARCPAGTRRTLLLLAACDGDLGALARVVDADRLLEDLEPAETAGLIRVTNRTAGFRHPLARAAAYSSGTSAERLRAHALLAEAYDDDPARQVWHRAEATVGPDESVARALAQAGDLAEHRSAPSEAARLLRRSAELSPTRAAREERLLRSAVLSSSAGDFAWVVEVAGRLRDRSEDPAIAIQAGQLAAYALAQTGQTRAARTAVEDVLAELIEAQPVAAWSTLTTLAVLVYRNGEDSGSLARWLERFERATDGLPTPSPELDAAARAWTRMAVDPLLPAPEVLMLVREAPVPQGDHLVFAAVHEMMLGAAAWLLDAPDHGLARLGRSVDLMRRANAPGAMTQTLSALGLVQFAVGDYDAADESGRLMLDLAEARNLGTAANDGLDMRAKVAGIRGDAERARELCERILQELGVGEYVALEANVRVTLSWARLAEQDVQGAWDELRLLFDHDGVPTHVHVAYRELGHCVSTAVRAGARSEAEPIVARAAERLTDAGPRYRLQLARARALLAGEDAEPLHLAAVTDPAATQWPFELANARLEYGGWLRRRRRQTHARAQLLPALATFERLGTRAWADLARSELRAAGIAATEPPAGVSAWIELTGQERQVVRLAASGMTNREIAAALYLSPRTVSTHLYHAFPKLGVSSRAQLRDVAEAHSE
ncbi:helix-turn-helix transcriptional regulator [Nocardioides insulae]|uniref:helix-turn-helix transcriptional regulator n=1 Tax=Nocardioides insulae TaxID=394734 RepID=UPI0003F540FC|nr:LuxR family transcriptional regulator [Nocardioides insulae]